MIEASYYLAMYKGRVRNFREWREQWLDLIIRLATRSPYSHCEIVQHLSDGNYLCYSASARDGGVRRKIMPLPADRWELFPLRRTPCPGPFELFLKTGGAAYDYRGALSSVMPWIKHARSRWFCSEWCAAAIGLQHPDRYNPADLVQALQLMGYFDE